MTKSRQEMAREAAVSVKTLNRELRELQAEYKEAPNFSFSKRVKVQIAEDIVRLEASRANYVRILNALNFQQRTQSHPVKRTASPRPQVQRRDSGGWQKVQVQRQIDELYKEIGAIGEQIASLGYTPERKRLVCKHKELIRQRRQLIWQVNQGERHLT